MYLTLRLEKEKQKKSINIPEKEKQKKQNDVTEKLNNNILQSKNIKGGEKKNLMFQKNSILIF